ncbi:carbohydrate ABC transporter permease [Cohnella sp. GCM10012308]|uniref:carbohydrate ABC transporter permease n=1 Tax=Cohnella sp. GCM10012308 TaxID=3317329 RepID=UPI00361A776C
MTGKRKSFYSLTFLLPGMAIYLVFFIGPNLLSLGLGFTDWSVYSMTEFGFNGLDNFKQMLSESIFKKSIVNTFYFAFATVILSNVIGFLLAVIMNAKLKLESFYRSAFFIPTTLSFLVVGPVFNALYNPESGPINTFLRAVGLGSLAKGWLVDPAYAMNSVIVMSVWSGIGVTILLYISGLQSVPPEYYEAAEIDGCTAWQKLRHVSIPLIVPSITVNIVLSLIGGLKVFGQVFVLTNGGPNDATQVFGTLIFKTFGDGLLGYSSAVGLVFTVIVCLMSFVLVYALRKLEAEY